MKKAVLHKCIVMHCKARQVLRNLFSANQGNGSDITFVAGPTKINFKCLKTWRHLLYNDGRFKPLVNSGGRLTWAYKLKALKPSSQISATDWFKIFLKHVIAQSYASQCCYQCSSFTSLRSWCWFSQSL